MIQIYEKKDLKLKFGLSDCFNYKAKRLCDKNPLICLQTPKLLKISEFKDFVCQSLIFLDEEYKWFNADYKNLFKACKYGFQGFYNSIVPFTFWEIQDRKILQKALEKLINDCKKRKDHWF